MIVSIFSACLWCVKLSFEDLISLSNPKELEWLSDSKYSNKYGNNYEDIDNSINDYYDSDDDVSNSDNSDEDNDVKNSIQRTKHKHPTFCD